jgi:hypothetical protein
MDFVVDLSWLLSPDVRIVDAAGLPGATMIFDTPRCRL